MRGGTGAVADSEQLYRRVPKGHGTELFYQINAAGKLVFQTAAFNDRGKSPSLDRACLAQLDPNRTRMTDEDGVIALAVDKVRGIGPIARYTDKQKRLPDDYGVDVVSDPLIGNCAHALVTITPPTIPATGSAFKKLKEGLVRIANDAGWSVQPHSPLPPRTVLDRVKDVLDCLRLRLTGAL